MGHAKWADKLLIRPATANQTGTGGPRTNHTKDTQIGVALVWSHEDHQATLADSQADTSTLTAPVCPPRSNTSRGPNAGVQLAADVGDAE